MSKRKTPIFISIDEEGLDDFFIWKHKIEASLKIDEHIPYRKFITENVKLGQYTYFSAALQEAIPFSIHNVGNDTVIFYAPNGDDLFKEFTDALKNTDYDISKLPICDIVNDSQGIDKTSFFTDSEGQMRLVKV